MVALGYDTAGLFSNDDELARQIEESAKRSFEPVWRLPIFDEHHEVIKSPYADLNNIGKYRYGGASQAAAFLERFVEGDTKWVHLDIAGPAGRPSAQKPDCANGNGFGAHLLIDYLMNY